MKSEFLKAITLAILYAIFASIALILGSLSRALKLRFSLDIEYIKLITILNEQTHSVSSFRLAKSVNFILIEPIWNSMISNLTIFRSNLQSVKLKFYFMTIIFGVASLKLFFIHKEDMHFLASSSYVLIPYQIICFSTFIILA